MGSAPLIGTISGSAHRAFTLTSGTLPTWVQVGATVSFANAVLPQNAISSIASYVAGEFQLQHAGVGGSGYQIYITQPWQAANVQFWQNCNPNDPLTQSIVSFNAGVIGGDTASSVDLTPTGSAEALWFMNDVYWATATGQERYYQTRLPLGHNVIALQTGGNMDLSLDTLTFYSHQGPAPANPAATGPLEFFPNASDGSWYYPFGGIAINQYCVLVQAQHYYGGVQSTSRTNATQMYWGNPSLSGGITNPSNWVPISGPFVDSWPLGNVSQWWWDGSSTGYVYTIGIASGTIGSLAAIPTTPLCAARFPYGDLNIASNGTPSLAGVQWWCGKFGWVNSPPYDKRFNVLNQLQPLLVPEELYVFGLGSMYQKSDGTIVRIDTLYDTAGPIYASNVASVNSQGSLGQAFCTPATIVESGTTYGTPYFGRAHTWWDTSGNVHGQRWSGITVNDVLTGYSTGPPGTLDGRYYQPYFLQTTGI